MRLKANYSISGGDRCTAGSAVERYASDVLFHREINDFFSIS